MKKWGKHLARSTVYATSGLSAFSLAVTFTVVTVCVAAGVVSGCTYLSMSPSHATTVTETSPKKTPSPLIGKITEFALPTPSSGPSAITAGPDGNLWFTEAGKIGRITRSGTITEFSLPTANSSPAAITSGPDGNLWFTETAGSGGLITSSQIGRITPTGKITEFPLPITSYLSGITSGPDGNLWFTENTTGKIGRITPLGVITQFSLPTGGVPLGITSGPDGNLWFTEFGSGKIGRITPLGIITEFSLPTANSHPVMITRGPDGNLWFTETIGPEYVIQPPTSSQIGRVTPEGEFTEFPIPNSLTQGGADANLGIVTGPAAITSGPDGNLWFTNLPATTTYKPSSIDRLTPEGKVTVFPLPRAEDCSYAIARGPDGNLWFTESTRMGVTGVVPIPVTHSGIGRFII